MNKALIISLCTAAASVMAMDAAMLARLEAHYNQTEDGRLLIHGPIVQQISVTNPPTIIPERVVTNRAGNVITIQSKTICNNWLISVYEDGYMYSNKWNAVASPTTKPTTTDTPSAKTETQKTEWQKRQDAVAEARKAAKNNITTHTEIITPGKSAKGHRVFSKLKLVLALQRIGKWEVAKEFIEANGLEDLYLAAVNVKEDDPYFKAGLEQVKTALNLTDKDVELILSNCIAE